MKYKIYQVDSFTKEKLSGNPASVVLNAEGLSDEQMRMIAREMNNSETAFVFRSDSPEYDIEVRFFTPVAEVPICGHATIATHYVYALENNIKNKRIIQKTKAGILPVDIEYKNGEYFITMTQGTPIVSDALDEKIVSKIIEAMGLDIKDVIREYPVSTASTGYGKVMLPIKSNDVLHNLKPNMQKLIEISKIINCNGYYVFTLNPDEKHLVHGRMFAPATGSPEDPVTGNANGPLGAYLVNNNILQNNEKTFDFDIVQGEAIKRRGTMHVHVEKENNISKLVQITGQAVIAFTTEIEI